MIKERKRWPIGVVVYLAVFYGGIIIILFMAFKTGVMPLMLLLIPSVMLFYDYISKLDYDVPGLKKAKNVIFLDGTIGVAETPIMPEYGGRATLMVGIKPDYCPEDEWERMSGMRGALATLAARVHLQVTRESWRFQELTGEELGAPEGAIIVLSGADPDRPVKLIDERLKSQLDYYSFTLKKVNTIVETAKSQMAVDSKEANQAAVEAIQTLIPILREIMAQKPQVMLPSQREGYGG